MPATPSFGVLSKEVSLDAPKAETPFRLAMLGDWSGRGNRIPAAAPEELTARRPLKVARDNLDEVMARLKVALDLPVGDDGDTVSLAFASLDDFHPDQLYDKVEKFEDLDDSDEKSELMRALLRHPDFQALESAWRGLDWLLRRARRAARARWCCST